MDYFHVYSRSSDGRHQLTTTPLTMDAAREFATEWLGRSATWQGMTRAVSMYGDVVTIERVVDQITVRDYNRALGCHYYAVPGAIECDDVADGMISDRFDECVAALMLAGF